MNDPNKRSDEEPKATENSRESNDGKFGYLGFTPSCLQALNNPWSFLAGIVGLTFGQALAVLGMLSIVMPQIEKRFNFSSFDIGMIAAANDVAAVVFGLLVSHYGNFGNKVKWIGFGGIITGIGFIIFTLPHYIIDRYDPPSVSFPALLCATPIPTTPPVNGTMNSESCDEGFIAEWYYLALLLIGQFIAGVGAITLFSFVPACFQECVSEKNMPLFLGLWQGSTFVGPMVAFGLSEPLLGLYVDIDQPEGFAMTPKDPRWIGNWWVGILGAAGVCFISTIFILGFPANIKNEKAKQKDTPTVSKKDDNLTELTAKEKLSELPLAMKRILTNWTFVFNCLAINCTLLYAEGLAPFIAKVLILRYGVEPQKVGNALTVATVPPLIIGVLAGSFMTRAFKLEDSGRKAAFFCFILQIFTIVGPMAFLTPGCDEINLAGWQVPYGVNTGVGKAYNFTEYPAIPGVELGSTCNQNCGCHLGIALPVCGSDGTSYLSPCYAGCSGVTSMTTFGNCSCIASNHGFGGTAEIGYCDQNCKNWVLFLILMSVVSLVVFLQLSPSKLVLIRCLRPEDLSFAFGLQFLSTKILAHIPGPILFGHVVDLNCVIWQKVCDTTGYCWIYDMDAQMKKIALIAGILAGIGMLCFLMSWVFYKEPERPSTSKSIGFENPALEKGMDDTMM